MIRIGLRSLFLLGFLSAMALGCAGDDIEVPIEEDENEPTLEVADSVEMVAQIGESVDRSLVIENTGRADLEVEIESDADWLIVERPSMAVTPSGSLVTVLTGQCPEEAGEQTTDLVIQSNDPERTEVTVSVTLRCEEEEIVVEAGSLSITFSGLPDGVSGAAVVEGPEGFEQQVDGDTLLSDLVVGSYEITVEDVEVGPATYAADGGFVEVSNDEEASFEVDYQLILGGLEVSVEGLPDGLNPSIELVGEDGSVAVPENGELADLTPGSYTLVPDAVTEGDATYLASEVDVSIVSGEMAEATVFYLLDPGSLAVTVEGLPGGVDHEIDLVAEDGTTTALPQSGELAALEPGEYTLEPREVVEAPATFVAETANVTIVSDEQATATVSYAAVPGQWEIIVEGLPDETAADIDVVGGDLDTTITETTSFDDLVPGAYIITPADITRGDSIFTAGDASVVVESGQNDSLTISYSAIPGTLSVIIEGLGGLAAEVDIIDSEGTTVETVSASEIVTGLAPGTYDVVPRDVEDGPATYVASEDRADVLSDTITPKTVTYELVPGSLEITATGLDGADLAAEVVGPGFSQSITGTTTLNGLTPGDYRVEFEEVTEGGAIYRITESVFDLEVASDASPTVTGEYSVVLGGLTVTADFEDDFDFEINLVDEGGSTVETASFGSQTSATFSDLEPGAYTIVAVSGLEDEWGNEYVIREGFDEIIDVNSDATASQTVSGIEPTLVTHGDDDGPHSLREVIGRVLVDSRITFADDVEEVVLSTGQIEIDKELTIVGGEDRVAIVVTGDHRAFYIDDDTDGSDVLLAQLLIGGGSASGDDEDADGGLIYATSQVTLFDMRLHDGYAAGHGGAVFAEYILFALATEFIDNRSENSSGAVFANGFRGEALAFEGNSTGGVGGALRAYTLGIVEDGYFIDNEADGSGGALYVDENTNELEINRVLFSENTSGSNGGALRTDGAELVTITNSTFERNTAEFGGGVQINGSDVTMTHVTMTNNTAGFGPAFDVSSNQDYTVSIGSSFIADNNYTSGQGEIYVLGLESGPVISRGYNFISRSDDTHYDEVSTDITGTDADPAEGLYNELARNAGFPDTISLQQDSPGYQAIPEADCVDANGEAMTQDQRGFLRPVAGFCTMGSWESNTQLETFDNSSFHATQYQAGSFVGVDGITWEYTGARAAGDEEIDGKGVIFRDAGVGIWAEGIPGGVNRLSLEYRKAFIGQNPRQFEVRINGSVVYTSDTFGAFSGADDEIYTMSLDGLGVAGAFDLEIRNLAPGGNAQITFDNIRWE